MIYKSISSLCEIYDVDRQFFERRMKDNIFVLNRHYIKQANTVRFDLDAVQAWWRGEEAINTNEILNKIL
jgi:hypothetical protein